MPHFLRLERSDCILQFTDVCSLNLALPSRDDRVSCRDTSIVDTERGTQFFKFLQSLCEAFVGSYRIKRLSGFGLQKRLGPCPKSQQRLHYHPFLVADFSAPSHGKSEKRLSLLLSAVFPDKPRPEKLVSYL